MHRASDYISDADIIRDAIERGVKRKAALVREAGGPLSAREVATLLGINPEELKAKKSYVAVSMDNGELVWPAFQFESHAMLSAVEKVCAAVNVDGAWAHLSFPTCKSSAEERQCKPSGKDPSSRSSLRRATLATRAHRRLVGLSTSTEAQ